MILYFSCLLALVAGLVAAPGDSTTRSLRMVYVQAPEDAPNKLYFLVGNDFKSCREVDLPRLAISKARLSVPSGMVRVFAATKVPTRDDPLPADAPFVDIPEAMQDPLLVLLPSGSPGPLGFRMLPVEFSTSFAPDGAILWFNLTERTIYAKLGSAQLIVPPRRSGMVVPSVKVGDSYIVSVDLSPESAAAATVPFLRTRWVKYSSRRELLFIVNDPTRRTPRVMSVPEVMVSEESNKTDKDKKRDPKKP